MHCALRDLEKVNLLRESFTPDQPVFGVGRLEMCKLNLSKVNASLKQQKSIKLNKRTQSARNEPVVGRCRVSLAMTNQLVVFHLTLVRMYRAPPTSLQTEANFAHCGSFAPVLMRP